LKRDGAPNFWRIGVVRLAVNGDEIVEIGIAGLASPATRVPL